ncbi:hypothetical protein DPMN_019677 [Dreissena polymorpha]|uniref:Uncharacterized protein n=1 Tax=Dreissena polymorpha TaxID=45954 RepID=A0A9D4NLG3_DREPO|nr:hypothetical protein DPMN_019677 [Dreissena polymorpha]
MNCFSLFLTYFELYRNIIGTKLLIKFHEDRKRNVPSSRQDRWKTARPPGNHTIFKLVREINKTNVLTNIHDDWAKIVTSRVFTRKTASPTGGHVFQWTGTILNSTNISLRQKF